MVASAPALAEVWRAPHLHRPCPSCACPDAGSALCVQDYAHLAEEMGQFPWAPEVFNCGAPDTGNMEVLARYGSRQQQQACPAIHGRRPTACARVLAALQGSLQPSLPAATCFSMAAAISCMIWRLVCTLHPAMCHMPCCPVCLCCIS